MVKATCPIGSGATCVDALGPVDKNAASPVIEKTRNRLRIMRKFYAVEKFSQKISMVLNPEILDGILFTTPSTCPSLETFLSRL